MRYSIALALLLAACDAGGLLLVEHDTGGAGGAGGDADAADQGPEK